MSNVANAAKFAKELDNFAAKVEVESENLVKDVTKTAFKIITGLSPVQTGSFVKSNKVGLSAPNPDVTRIPEPLSLSEQQAKSQAYASELPKIDLFKLEHGSIFISNDIEYALNVEFGWPTKTGYAPYRLAYEAVKAGVK